MVNLEIIIIRLLQGAENGMSFNKLMKHDDTNCTFSTLANALSELNHKQRITTTGNKPVMYKYKRNEKLCNMQKSIKIQI